VDGPDPTPALQRFDIDGTPPQGRSLIEPWDGVWCRVFVDGAELPLIRKSQDLP
jgi:hypothetical protein